MSSFVAEPVAQPVSPMERYHRPRGPHSNVSRLHLLHRCSRPLHAIAGSHPHSGHHIRHSGHAPSWPAGYPVLVAHRPSPPTRDVSLSHDFPGQTMWNSTFPDNRPPSHSQRTRGALSPHAEGSHYVPRRPAVDRGASPGPPRNPHSV
jgi:hypothetical protein